MLTCDDYQLALDMLEHGAACDLTAAEVEAHLAGCAVCTAYRVGASLQGLAPSHWLHHDEAALLGVRRRIRDERTRLGRARWLMPLVVVGLWILVPLASGLRISWTFTLLMLASIPLDQLIARRRLRHLVHVDLEGGDLLAAMRRHTTRQLRDLGLAGAMLGLVIVAGAGALAFATPSRWIPVAGALAVLAAAGGLLRRRRRLLRAMAELAPAR
jgi:hypothetical protein